MIKTIKIDILRVPCFDLQKALTPKKMLYLSVLYYVKISCKNTYHIYICIKATLKSVYACKFTFVKERRKKCCKNIYVKINMIFYFGFWVKFVTCRQPTSNICCAVKV